MHSFICALDRYKTMYIEKLGLLYLQFEIAGVPIDYERTS